jgi:tetratricopeptide (TPR) repeat protein
MQQAAGLADKIALSIQGDTELQSAALLRLIELHLSQGERSLAQKLLPALSGHYNGLAQLRFAEHETTDRESHLSMAKKAMERTTGSATDTLRAAFARARLPTQGSEWVEQITDPELKLSLKIELELLARKSVTPEEVQALSERIQEVAKGNPFPAVVSIAQKLVVKAQTSHTLSEEERVNQVKAALALGEMSHVAHPEMVFSAATALKELGQEKLSDTLFQAAATETQHMPLSYEERYLSYARWAEHWAKTHQAERAAKLLEEAERVAQQHLSSTEIAKVMIAIAQAWQKSGKLDRAEQTCLTLLKSLTENPNLRLRQLAALEVLHFYLQHQHLPTDPVRSALSAVEHASRP